MNRLLRFLLLLSLSFSAAAWAEQKKTLGNWDVHYMALDTTFLTPQVAKAYGITRSKNRALINISVLDRRSKKAQDVEITGQVRDLLGSNQALEFKQVVEGEAIYYLATLAFEDREHYRFEISIRGNNQSQTLKFEQKLYKE